MFSSSRCDIFFFFHFHITCYRVYMTSTALGRRVRNDRKETTCECFKGIQEVEERKLGEGKR